MSPSRLVVRWSLTVLALALTLVAVLVLALRFGLGQVDRWSSELEETLSSRFSAEVSIGRAQGGMSGLDPWFTLEDLDFRSREGLGHVPLLEIEHASLALDSSASLKDGLPVLGHSHLSGITLHLYQNDDLGWQWPAPADVPPELVPSGSFDLSRLDFWVGVLLRQRAWADDLRLVLHGRKRQMVLESPRLLVSRQGNQTHLEGQLSLRDQPGTAFQTVMNVTWQAGDGDAFDAALQADMQLQSLVGVAEVMGIDDVLRLDQAQGDLRLWGRWKDGRLDDIRLDLQAPSLVLSRDSDADNQQAGLALADVALQGKWRRDSQGEGWQAWVTSEARGVDAPYADSAGPPLPRHWHVTGEGSDWWARGSRFELGALSAWHDRFPLPESLTRSVRALAPRGHVNGLAFGYRDGQWRARAGASGVSVSPWEDAPGGGPVDLWVEADGSKGHVQFVDAGNATLSFPGIFEEALALEHASGEVVWSFAGEQRSVSGQGLKAVWQGAEIEGGFGLSMDTDNRGGLGLQLAFENVNALDRPLTDWLPMPLIRDDIDAELAEWLSAGLAGHVPQGMLSLHAPFDGRPDEASSAGSGTSDDTAESLQLELDVEQGRVPFDPAWPALEQVRGHLSLKGEALRADVAHAESLGVRVPSASVTLDGEEVLRAEAAIEAAAPALARYFSAMPVEGMAAAADWQGEGNVTGSLDLAVPLSRPEALTLSVDSQVALETLTHGPTSLTLKAIDGPLSWQQEGETGHLTGQLDGRLLGGELTADIDTGASGIRLSGRVSADALDTLELPEASRALVQGDTAWQGQIRLDTPTPQLSLTSQLEGLAVELPSPLGKSAASSRPLKVDMALGEPLQLTATLGEQLGLRWQSGASARGQVWAGRKPSRWPTEPGWSVQADLPRFAPQEWASALSPLMSSSGGASVPSAGAPRLANVRLQTGCLLVEQKCLGSLNIAGGPTSAGWAFDLDGSLLSGRLDYQPSRHQPLDIRLQRLQLGELLPEGGMSASTSGAEASQSQLFAELDVPAAPAPMLSGVAGWPAGHLSVDRIHWQSNTLGPFSARWQTAPDQLTLDPVELTLGDIQARGNLTWEASGPDASLTRSRLTLNGGNVGSALEALGQPVAVTSQETRINSQLAWPGAPWQFSLAQSRGDLQVELRDGHFANMESTPARLIGLVNVDNLLRRLRLDFSDVTGEGTAFDSVTGDATLYGGTLETRGPVQIDGAATSFTLQGSVDLVRRELDQRLGVTVPVSNNLPLAAVVAGAPIVGGALFVADKLFGDAIDRVTRIHYRVRGPWTSPRISLESTE